MPKGKRKPTAEIRPPSLRGVIVVDSINGKPRTRAWPRPRPAPRHPTNVFWTDWLVGMTYLYRYVPARMQAYFTEVTKGTPWMPRDIHISTGRGRAWAFKADDGRTYVPVPARAAVSQSLDTLAQVTGEMLYRAANTWKAITAPAEAGQYLQAVGSPPVPEWTTPVPPGSLPTDTVSWNPLAKPAAPSTDDDEFATAGAGPPTGWTAWDYGAIGTEAVDDAGLALAQANQTNGKLSGIYKALPSGDFTIWTRCSAGAIAGEMYAQLAIFQDAASSTADIHSVGLRRTSTPGANVNRWSDYDNLSSQLASLSFNANTVWARIDRTGSTYQFWWSENGITWWRLYTTAALGYTPTHMGLICANINTTGDGVARFPFFRYMALQATPVELLPGARTAILRAS